MSVISKRARLALFAGAAALVPASGAFAQEEMPQRSEDGTLATVYGRRPAILKAFPKVRRSKASSARATAPRSR